MESRLVELEKKMAFQEDTIEQLNQVVIGLQKKVSFLEAELKRLKEQQVSSGYIKKADEEVPPPHYGKK